MDTTPSRKSRPLCSKAAYSEEAASASAFCSSSMLPELSTTKMKSLLRTGMLRVSHLGSSTPFSGPRCEPFVKSRAADWFCSSRERGVTATAMIRLSAASRTMTLSTCASAGAEEGCGTAPSSARDRPEKWDSSRLRSANTDVVEPKRRSYLLEKVMREKVRLKRSLRSLTSGVPVSAERASASRTPMVVEETGGPPGPRPWGWGGG